MSRDTLTLNRRQQANGSTKPSPSKNKPRKPKAWNHQDELKSMRGKEVEVTLTDDDWDNGVLQEADQFTIKVNDRILFKSQIKSIKEG